MKYIISLFISLCALSSCQINSTVHFNKNYSGSSSTTIDLSEILAFASGLSDDSSDGANELDSLFMLLDDNAESNDSLNFFLDSVKTILGEAGLQNFKLNRDGEYGLNLSYDFDDLDVFDGKEIFEKISNAVGDNNDLNFGGEDAEMLSSLPTSTSINRKGNWLIIDFFGGMTYEDYKKELIEEARKTHIEEYGNDADFSEKQSLDDAKMANGFMSGLMKFNNTYTFDRKIKEIQSSLPYKNETKSVTLSYSLGDLYEVLEEEGSVEVRIKLR